MPSGNSHSNSHLFQVLISFSLRPESLFPFHNLFPRSSPKYDQWTHCKQFSDHLQAYSPHRGGACYFCTATLVQVVTQYSKLFNDPDVSDLVWRLSSNGPAARLNTFTIATVANNAVNDVNEDGNFQEQRRFHPFPFPKYHSHSSRSFSHLNRLICSSPISNFCSVVFIL